MRYQALLFCPDEKIARVVTQVLSELDFSVEPASEPFAAVKKLMAQHFDAIVVDCENEQNATLLFKSARNSNSNQFSLAVAVVEGQAGVAKAFRIGANLVLTKPINVEQAKGTLRVARGLLRKSSESGKTPPAQSATFTAQSARPEIPASDASRTSADSSLTQKPGFETPKAESALAIPAPGLGMSAPNQTSSKSYPWQPASKAPSEPMASALQRAAEAAGKSAAPAQETKSAKSASSHSTSTAIRQLRPFTAPMRGAEGAASAPALAKEKPRGALVFDIETEEPAQKLILSDEGKPQFAGKHSSSTAVVPYPAATVPSFSSFGSDDAEKEASGNRQIRLIVIAVILLLVVAGYFRWTIHRKASPQPIVPTQVHASTPVPQVSSPVQDAAAPQIQEQAANTLVEAEPAPAESTSVAKSTSVANTTAPASTATTKGAASAPSPTDNIRVAKAEPIVVKTDLSKPEAQARQDAPLPGVLNIGTGSNADKAISNLMATTAVNVPKPVPQVVRVSQGVSQGLLMKKVQPTYPSQALTMRLQGTVQLQATISKNGSITNLTVLSGQASLAHAAVDAVRQWKYKPYFLNGEPVEIQTQIAVNFKLPN